MAFMPFVTCGDPDMPTTLALIEELADQGVDLIEVGFPYSDPIADGPVIQASYTRALDNNLTVGQIMDGIRSLTADASTAQKLPPLVAMVSYAIVFRWGPEEFAKQARDVGFSGLIIPDLPGDEAAEFAEIARSCGLDLVQLIAPTTPPERVERILKSAGGFVYCVSVAGTTGVRAELPAELHDQLKDLRGRTDLPLAVGFGISTPEHVDALRDVADGVIVGSAIVRQFEPPPDGKTDPARAVKNVGQLAKAMVAETHR